MRREGRRQRRGRRRQAAWWKRRHGGSVGAASNRIFRLETAPPVLGVSLLEVPLTWVVWLLLELIAGLEDGTAQAKASPRKAVADGGGAQPNRPVDEKRLPESVLQLLELRGR